MAEYTLVFRRVVARNRRARDERAEVCAWVVLRPACGAPDGSGSRDERPTNERDLAQVFAVPICSALGMDVAAYERFLVDSGALQAALVVLGSEPITRPTAVITLRKEIQALVMAAEVQHIIGRLSA